jgi:flavin-dependent dehydrogenase
VTFHYGEERVVVPVKPHDGVDALYAPRRTVLDPVLVAAARAAGAEVRHGVHLRALARDASGRVRGAVLDDGTVACDLLIGADGLRSTVAGLVGAEPYLLGRHAAASIYGHFELPVEGYHWHFRPGASAGEIPTNDGATCVSVTVPPERLAEGFHALLAEAAPELADRVAGARLVGRIRGFAGSPATLRRAAGDGWALVGDAGLFRDPITSHGITDALRDAELLARAVVAGDLPSYQAERDRVALGVIEATDAIASFSWDVPAVKLLHRRFNDAMKPGVAALAALDDAPLGASAGQAA